MILTNTYSRVAIFDTQPEFTQTQGSDIENYNFVANGIEYQVIFENIGYNLVLVEFGMYNIVAKGQERVEILNKLDSWFRERYAKGPYFTYSLVGIGNSYKVFSGVISAIKRYIALNPKVKRVKFSAAGEDRVRVYDALVSKLAKPGNVSTSEDGGHVEWTIYLEDRK